MKKVLLIILIPLLIAVLGIAVLFTCWLLSDEDFAPYQRIKYDIKEEIEGNIFVISEIEEEIKDIAKKYSKDVHLCGAEYKFYDENKGEVMLTYGHTNEDTHFSTRVEIYIDIAQSKAVRVRYEYGTTKSVGWFDYDFMGDKDCDVQKLYLDAYSQADKPSDMEYASVNFYGRDIVINLWDKNDNNLFHTEKSNE